MTGRGIDQILPHPGNPVLHEAFVKDARRYVRLAEQQNRRIPKPVDYRYIWGDALDVWNAREPDLRIINLETSVTTSDDYWPSKGINYRMHPRNVPCLTAAGIDCCVLANNHVMDWGKCDVLVFAVADVSSGVPKAWSADEHRAGVHLLDDLSPRTADRIGEQIAAEKKPDDIVILSIHWGGNWGYRIPAKQRQFAHHLIDTGAVDIVHGHSSHHPKAIECYRGKAIIYGCGDFLNDYEGIGGYEHYRSWLAPMYFVTVNLHSRQVERLEIELLRLRRFRLEKASAPDRRWLRNKLNEFGNEFATITEGNNGTMIAGPCTPGNQGGEDEYSKH